MLTSPYVVILLFSVGRERMSDNPPRLVNCHLHMVTVKRQWTEKNLTAEKLMLIILL